MMHNIKNLAKECFETKRQLNESSKVKVIGAKYYLIKDNDTIIESDFDNILDNKDFELVYIFPKIKYIFWTTWYESYLRPIIIDKSLNVFDGEFSVNEWVYKFSDQPLDSAPFESSVPKLTVVFKEKEYFRFEFKNPAREITKLSRLLASISNCNTQHEVSLVFKIFNSNIEYQKLVNQIEEIKKEIYYKNLAIEGYKGLLDSITSLIQDKKNI